MHEWKSYSSEVSMCTKCHTYGDVRETSDDVKASFVHINSFVHSWISGVESDTPKYSCEEIQLFRTILL